MANHNEDFRAFFISDIHIQSMQEEKARLFLKFLKEIPQGTTHLFLLGDIFDMWVGSHSFYVERFQPIVDEIKNKISAGLKVIYFEGNHDFEIGRFWEKVLGVKVFDSPQYFDLGTQRIRLEHGDESNPDDLSYLRLRKVLRSRAIKFVIKNIPSPMIRAIGENWSRISRQSRPPYVNEKVKLRARQYAIESLSKREYDVVIFGHIHMRDEFKFEFNGKNFEYINLGSWMESPVAYEITSSHRGFVKIS